MAECNIPKEPNAVEDAIAKTIKDIERAGFFYDPVSRLAATLPLQRHLSDLLDFRAELLRHPHPHVVASGDDTNVTGESNG